MPQTVAELLDAAMTLSESERAELAELLAATVDAPTGRLHPAWATEIRRRSAEVESGAVVHVRSDDGATDAVVIDLPFPGE